VFYQDLVFIIDGPCSVENELFFFGTRYKAEIQLRCYGKLRKQANTDESRKEISFNHSFPPFV
jgi:hypothetical protein